MINKYCLYLTFDDRYIDGALITIYSFIKNNKWFKGDIVIGCPNEEKFILSKENRDKILEIYSNTLFIDIDKNNEVYVKLNQAMNDNLKNRFGPIIYKFHAFQLSEYDRIVIMDADFLVVDDISELFFNEDIKFGAAIDFCYKKEQLEYKERTDEYFNVGIMSVGKENITVDIINEAISILENGELNDTTKVKHFKGLYPEQDLLNVIMSKRKVTLLPTTFQGNGRSVNSCDDCKCIHYWGELKPWKIKVPIFNIWNKWGEYKKEYEERYNNETLNTFKTLLCCIGKNENNYIREYVEWYKNLGVSHIRIYDNNDIDGENFEDIIGDYINNGFVDIVNYRGKDVCQLESYQNCYDELKNEYDWFLFFDCDEFLSLINYDNIKEYLTESTFDNYDMIHINWMTFGDNGHLTYTKESIVKKFKTPVPYTTKAKLPIPENMHIKTILRGGLNNIKWVATPHTPYNFGIKCCNDFGDEEKSEYVFQKISYRKAFLRHYSTKTITEYCDKMKRGFPDQTWDGSRVIDLLENIFFKINEITKEKIDIVKEKLGIDLNCLLPQPFEGKKSNDIQIFSLCYSKKDFEFINNEVITPLQVGAANGTNVCYLKDNTGDNISDKNYFYIENTGTYWIWKNVNNVKYKGQMQYRRPLSGISNDTNFNDLFSKYDVITCKPFNHPENNKPTENQPMFIPANTVEEGYIFSNCKDDIMILEMIINIYHPEYKESYKKYIKEGENLYYSNGFIMKSEDYDKYCEFLFDCLEKYQKFIDVSSKEKLYERVKYNMEVGKYPKHQHPSQQTQDAIRWQMSIGGFLSERIWTLWLQHNFNKDRILELPYIKMEKNMYT